MSLPQDIEILGEDVRQLRVAYEKYFAGIDRREPIDHRKRVKDTLRRLRGQVRNRTVLRFKLQTLQASVVTHESYWNRICRKIEEGTYKRDVRRAQKRQEQLTCAPAKRSIEASNSPKKASDQGAHSPALRELYAAYITAQKEAGQTTMVDIRALAKTIEKQTIAIKSKYNCSSVDFKVAIKNGKAILKAVVK